jgi:hypothetical protein
MNESMYALLPTLGAIAPRIGNALIATFEPHPGHEHAYNRWYEDDHFYVAALTAPWSFSGRRWVAPRSLQQMRLPRNHTLFSPPEAGVYLSLSWILAGHASEFQAWIMAMQKRIRDEQRNFPQRSHIFSTYQEYAGAVYRDAKGPRDIHALDYPYRGVALEVVEPLPGTSFDSLQQWLMNEHAPRKLADSAAAQCLVFLENDDPLALLARPDIDDPAVARRITLLWFLESEPEPCWNTLFGEEERQLAASRRGRLLMVAPFIPTLPGTDVYVDQLR